MDGKFTGWTKDEFVKESGKLQGICDKSISDEVMISLSVYMCHGGEKRCSLFIYINIIYKKTNI